MLSLKASGLCRLTIQHDTPCCLASRPLLSHKRTSFQMLSRSFKTERLVPSYERERKQNETVEDVKRTDETRNHVALAAYQTFASVFLAVFAVTAVGAPIFMKHGMGIEWTASRELLTRCTGALLFMPMSLAGSMKTAIALGRVDSQLYKRIGWSLSVVAAFDALLLLSFCQSAAFSWIYGAILTIARILPTVAFTALYGFSAMRDIGSGILSAMAATLRSKNPVSVFFSFFIIVILGCAFGSLLNPVAVWTFMLNAPVDSFAVFSVRCLGSSLILLSFLCIAMKEAAVEGELDIMTFKRLNTATFVSSLGIIGSSLMMSWRATSSFSPGIVPPLLTTDGCLVTVGICGTLALLSSWNACLVTHC